MEKLRKRNDLKFSESRFALTRNVIKRSAEEKIRREKAETRRKIPNGQLHRVPWWLRGNREINWLGMEKGAARNRQVVLMEVPAYLALELARRGKTRSPRYRSNCPNWQAAHLEALQLDTTSGTLPLPPRCLSSLPITAQEGKWQSTEKKV